MPRYLGCLPLGFGVLRISCIQFIVSAAVTGLLTYGLIRESQGKTIGTIVFDFTPRMRIAAIVLAVIYGLVALTSLTGFVGAIRKSYSAVRLFLHLRVFLLLQVIAAIAFFVLYGVDRDEFMTLCAEGVQGVSTSKPASDTCDRVVNRSLAVMIVSVVVLLIHQGYSVYIVSAYAHELHQAPHFYAFKGADYAEIEEELEAHPLTHNGAGSYGDA
ncbi:hypothetical protein B0H17DRAFT_1186044 [Mycena rosella]|uniref:Uncharacterized protein n=1 Tax=Mycena rosella TaxID=1033263 RepID=A0AAD7G0R3_MYCRO|nr:hypothetical protein B0H17DRAFT_1186044 [Mycena rosella]